MPPITGIEIQRLPQDSRDHTLLEAVVQLNKALKGAFTQLKDALWKDNRAPVSLSLISTSISSVFVGIALVKHRQWPRPRIDDGFFALLANTLIQLFSLYVLLLPFLRGQQPHLRGLWFCLSIGTSIVFSIIACIVYIFSWHASTILNFGSSLASMITALLLVQSIDKDDGAKDVSPGVGDV